MAQLLIVTSSINPAHSSLRLLKKAQDMGYDAMSVAPESPGAADVINTSDKVIFRISASNYFTYKRLGSQLVPPKAALLQGYLSAYDKMNAYNTLEKAGIPQPKTESISLDALRHIPTYPVVLKYPFSNRGVGVYLIASHDDLAPILKAHEGSTTDFLLQEFIKESSGHDKRLMVVGKKVVASMARSSRDGSFKANVSAGATARSYEPTKDECDIAIRACGALAIPFAGVDIIDSVRGPLVLEVNPSPGFKIETITDVAVIKEILKYIMEDQHD